MSFCPNCGKKIERDEAYCSQCGNELVKQNMEQKQIDRIQEELKNTRRNEIGSGFISGFFLGAGIGGLIVYKVGGFDYSWIMLASTVLIVVSVVFAITSGVYHKKYRDLKKRL